MNHSQFDFIRNTGLEVGARFGLAVAAVYSGTLMAMNTFGNILTDTAQKIEIHAPEVIAAATHIGQTILPRL